MKIQEKVLKMKQKLKSENARQRINQKSAKNHSLATLNKYFAAKYQCLER